MVKVVLAGYNLDKEFIDAMRKNFDKAMRKNLIVAMMKEELLADVEPTPETISAAYARISRFADDVTELRAKARRDVPAAKKSNSTIVFDMGHHSVAEHVQLNFDVLHLSRLAIEALEAARIGAAYTEKSQRYITLDGDYVTPAEFDEDERKLFVEMMDKQVETYKRLFPILLKHQQKLHPDMLDTKKKRDTVEGWAKEDARYALGMATEGQLGLSMNTRTLEYTIRKLRHDPLAEVRDLSNQLFTEGGSIAPSLILLSDPEEFEKATGKKVSDKFFKDGRRTLEEATERVFEEDRQARNQIYPVLHGQVSTRPEMMLRSKDIDGEIIAALLFTSSVPPRPYSECSKIAEGMSLERRSMYIQEILTDLTEFDQVPREFEMGSLDFEAIVSSSCFAQLKRHRMMTLLKQKYEPKLDYTYPEAVIETGQQQQLKDLLDQTSELFYERLIERNPEAAEYVLTNAHRRRVLMRVNMREMYHIARLRMDAHAQWDIRKLATDMIELAKEIAPATMLLACGKDRFNDVREQVYGKSE